MAEETQIQLIAQRLEAQEKLNAEQARQIEGLQADNAKLKGAQEALEKASNSGIARFAMQGVSALVVAIVGGVIWTGMDANTRDNRGQEAQLAMFQERLAHVEEHTDDEGHPDRMIARLDVIDKEIEVLSSRSRGASSSSVSAVVADLHSHETQFAHPDATVALTRIEERLDTIDREQVQRSARLQRIEAATIGLESAVQTLQAGYVEHEEELDAAELNINELENRVSSTQASTSAAFVEVETQIRAWVDTANQRAAYNHILLQQIARDADPTSPLPDMEFFPERIPAQATTQVGKINGE